MRSQKASEKGDSYTLAQCFFAIFPSRHLVIHKLHKSRGQKDKQYKT